MCVFRFVFIRVGGGPGLILKFTEEKAHFRTRNKSVDLPYETVSADLHGCAAERGELGAAQRCIWKLFLFQDVQQLTLLMARMSALISPLPALVPSPALCLESSV